MIHPLQHFMSEHPGAAERTAGVATLLSGVSAVGGTIADVNNYLQAGAYVVAMISGLAATYYYVCKKPK